MPLFRFVWLVCANLDNYPSDLRTKVWLVDEPRLFFGSSSILDFFLLALNLPLRGRENLKPLSLPDRARHKQRELL